MLTPLILEPKTTTPPPECPPGYHGVPPECKCFEDNTAYFGNNAQTGAENPQPSRVACQRSCQQHPTCQYWTWGKGGSVIQVGASSQGCIQKGATD